MGETKRKVHGIGGFSANNVWRMRAFHLAYRQSSPILAQPVQEIAGTPLPQDNPSIGLILCRHKKQTTVEYALRHTGTPVGVAEWQTKLVKALPKELKGNLPTVEEIEKELGDGR